MQRGRYDFGQCLVSYEDLCLINTMIRRPTTRPSTSMVQEPLVGQGLLTVNAARSHSDTPHSVRLLWTRDRPDLYVTAHNNHKRPTSMSPAGFEPAIRASGRPQAQDFDRAATGFLHVRYQINLVL